MSGHAHHAAAESCMSIVCAVMTAAFYHPQPVYRCDLALHLVETSGNINRTTMLRAIKNVDCQRLLIN